ncbi:MAG: hypothetical protein Q8908_04045, partial [Bacteroidota bacterium]|nr:hypothetical protein [Bacteroidota bacterium]
MMRKFVLSIILIFQFLLLWGKSNSFEPQGLKTITKAVIEIPHRDKAAVAANGGKETIINTTTYPPDGGIIIIDPLHSKDFTYDSITGKGIGSFADNGIRTLTAIPAPGCKFINWTYTDGSGNNVLLDLNGKPVGNSYDFHPKFIEHFNIIANFNYIITAKPNIVAGGTVTGSGDFSMGMGDYPPGCNATLTATPSTGYEFVNWTDATTGQIVSTSAVYSFGVTAPENLIANFKLTTYTLTAISNPSSGGSTTGSGTYLPGITVPVTTTPSPGYVFVNWTEGGAVVSYTPAFSVTADRNRTLQANFIQQFTIATSVNPSVGGSTSGGGVYNAGAAVTLNATSFPGYVFVNWTEGGTTVSTNPSLAITVDKDRTLQANFIQQFTIATSSSPSSGGSTSGAGTYNAGSAVALNATPSPGYAFVNWTEGGTIVSSTPSFSVTADKDRSLQANFIQQFTITTSSSPSAGGSTSGAGIYNAGSAVTLNATPSTGHAFVSWTEDGVVVSSTPSFSVTADKDRSLQANFIQQFTI